MHNIEGQTEALIINVHEMLNARGIGGEEERPLDGAFLLEFWAKHHAAVLHDPARHVMTRPDGSHVEGKPSTTKTLSCVSCGSLVANEPPWIPSSCTRKKVAYGSVSYTRTVSSMCYECHRGTGVNREEFEAWEKSLTKKQAAARAKRQSLIKEAQKRTKKKQYEKQKKQRPRQQSTKPQTGEGA